VAERERATPYMVLLAAFALVLASYSGDSDLVVGTPVAGRHRAETEPLIGFFVNTLPLRVTLTPGLSFRELVDQVRRTCLDAYRHQDVPFSRIVSVLHPDRAGAPLVRAMLALGNVPTPRLELPGLTATILDPPVRASKFDLNVELTPMADGGLTGRAEFTVDLYDEVTVARWMDSWREVLTAAVSAPDTDLARLPLPSPVAIARPSTQSVPLPTPARVYVAPADPLEILLARMWTEVLQTDHIGAEDDFFALGGHSLLATQVRARIRGTFGIELPLRGLLAVSTVRDLAGYLRELGREASLDVDGLAAGAGTAASSIRRLDRTQYRSVKPR
jgi:non-ribosomal peptide synthetase component F